MKQSNYMAFLQEAKQFIPQERIYTDDWHGERTQVFTASSRKS